jgi:hypothetical protein
MAPKPSGDPKHQDLADQSRHSWMPATDQGLPVVAKGAAIGGTVLFAAIIRLLETPAIPGRRGEHVICIFIQKFV